MRLRNWLGLLFGLGWMLTACGSAPETAAPAVEFESILLENFDNENNFWQKIDVDKKGEAGYAGGKYRMQATESNTFLFAFPVTPATNSLRDVSVLVEAELDDGASSNNLYGVICRYINRENFYFLVISSDGYFGIGKVIDGMYQLINRSDYPPSEVILTGEKTNRIRADCVGSTLTLYVNDQWVDSQDDTDLITGKVGLITGTLEGQTTILFDAFEIRGLKP
jgi:hypothetical protein